jgi:hypothetical protein
MQKSKRHVHWFNEDRPIKWVVAARKIAPFDGIAKCLVPMILKFSLYKLSRPNDPKVFFIQMSHTNDPKVFFIQMSHTNDPKVFFIQMSCTNDP